MTAVLLSVSADVPSTKDVCDRGSTEKTGSFLIFEYGF